MASPTSPRHVLLAVLFLSTIVQARDSSSSTDTLHSASPAQVDLGIAGTFAILSKAGITSVPTSEVWGNVGTSPITGAAIGVTCLEVNGAIYAVDAAGPAPCSEQNGTLLTTAVNNMESAYTDAAGRAPDVTELGAGNIGGLVLAPGVYKWSTNVSIPTNVTLSGGGADVWIFQIAQDLLLANGVSVDLLGGAQAKNIFWQVAGQATLGTTSHFEGTILSQSAINMQTGASLNGSLLAQTEVTLQMSTIASSRLTAVDYVLGEGLGFGAGNTNLVRVFTRDGTSTQVQFQAYGSGQWGTNISSGDIDGGTYDEILSGPGPGPIYGPHVRAFANTGAPLQKVSFYAYGTLRYGVNVASAEADGDGFAEILSGAGPGAVFGPHVRGWNFDNATLGAMSKLNFYAYGSLRYGVNVEDGNVDADTFDEILTGPGPGPVFTATVRGFDYDDTAITAIAKIAFNAFTSNHGVNVAGGDVDGDGFAEIACAPGPALGNSSRFLGFDFDGAAVSTLPGFDVTSFSTTYGGRVGLADLMSSGEWNLLAGAGRDPAADSTVRSYGYAGGTLTPMPGSGFMPFTAAGYGYGVNVAGGALGY